MTTALAVSATALFFLVTTASYVLVHLGAICARSRQSEELARRDTVLLGLELDRLARTRALATVTPGSQTALTDTGERLESATVILFAQSARQVVWDPAARSILELAESEGIQIPAGCRRGRCGTCRLAVKAGAVECPGSAQTLAGDHFCLPCVSIPISDLVLDA